MNPLKALHAAAALFSVLPVAPLADVDRKSARGAIAALPWLGLMLGGLAGVVAAGLATLGLPALIQALPLGLLAALTGFLHLDGLADVADGLGSRKPAAEALDIMKKSDIGPMGVIALLFVLLLEVACLAALTTVNVWFGAAAIACGPMIGRAAVLWATRPAVPTARPGGFGSLVVGVTEPGRFVLNAFAIATTTILLLWLIGGWPGLATAIGGLLVAASWAAFWTRHLVTRFGGSTGDCFGSLIETTQLAFWLAIVLGQAILATFWEMR